MCGNCVQAQTLAMSSPFDGGGGKNKTVVGIDAWEGAEDQWEKNFTKVSEADATKGDSDEIAQRANRVCRCRVSNGGLVTNKPVACVDRLRMQKSSSCANQMAAKQHKQGETRSE